MSVPSDDLAALRRQIDDLDEAILKLLAQRMAIVRQVGRYKQNHAMAPLDTTRWQAVLETRVVTAKSLQLSEAFITNLYQLIHEYALQIESEAAQGAET